MTLQQGEITVVEEVILGSELTADVASSATSLFVGDPYDFSEEGGLLTIADDTNPETLSYNSMDVDTGEILLSAPTGFAHLAEVRVNLEPEGREKYAHVRLDGEDETITVRIPHSLFDRVPEGIRIDGEGESIGIEMDGWEWIVHDILGVVPVIDGDFIDPDTLPPADASDGLAPSVSPTPTVQGGIGFLIARWLAVPNADTVTYEVHVSPTADFTPSSATLSGEVAGTAFTIRKLPEDLATFIGTPTVLTFADSTTDGSSFSTVSVSPAADRQLLAFVGYYRDDSTVPTAPTVTGNGLTWTEIASIPYDDTNTTRARLSVFAARGPAPSAGAITFNFGAQTITSLEWSIVEIPGADGIQQVGTVQGTANNHTSAALASFADLENRPFAAIAANTSTDDPWAVESGWTKLSASGVGTPSNTLTVQWKDEPDQQTQWTTGASSAGCASIILEVARTTGVSATLQYSTPYYVKIIAKDADGSAAAGSQGVGEMVAINSSDISAQSIVANHLLAGEITADKFASVLALSSKIIAGAEGGQRVELDTGGIILYGSDGVTPIASIPTSGDPFFRATVEALGLDVTGDSTFRGDNLMTVGSTMTLARQVNAPSTAPSVSQEWDYITGASDPTLSTYGIFFDTSGFGTQDTFYRSTFAGFREIRAATGVVERAVVYPAGFNPRGVVRLSTNVFALGLRQVGTSYHTVMLTYLQSNLSLVSETDINTDVPYSSTGSVALGTDGTDLLVGRRSVTTGSVLKVSPTTFAVSSTVTLTGTTFSTGSFLWLCDDGSNWWVADSYNAVINSYNRSTGAVVANTTFTSGGGARPEGLTFADTGGSFRTASTGKIYSHTSWTWTTESPVYWVRYTWRDNTNSYETTTSPTATKTMSRRAKMRVTTADLPGTVTGVNLYMDRGSSDPGSAALNKQATNAAKSSTLSTFDGAGAAPPGSNTFPDADEAQILSDDGNPLIRATGYPRVRLRRTTTQALSDSTLTEVSWGTQDVDTDNFWDGSPATDITLPFTGQYMVTASCQFVQDINGRRVIRVVQAGSLVGKGTNLAVQGESHGLSHTEVLNGTAGQVVTIEVYHSAGGSLNLQSARVTVLYLGPS